MTKLVFFVACLLVGCGDHSSPKASSDNGSAQGGGASQGGGATQSGIVVAIAPKSLGLAPGGMQAFTCTVIGSSNAACTWKVMENGGGTITADGLYTAPSNAGTYHIIAASAADPSATDTASVAVTDHLVGACDKLAAVGTWENVTPPQLGADNWCVPGAACQAGMLGTYGTNAFVIDPNNSGTVYLGTASLGIWKTTDCGSTWEKIDTGTNATSIDAGRNWSMIMDPTDSQTIYTVTGYAGAGFYKTTDGGKDWQQMFSATLLATLPGQGIEKLAMDPTNNLHLTASFHNPCANSPMGGGDWACMAETKDGGMNFTLTNSAENWTEGDGQTMVSDQTWFFSSGGGQIWQTTNGGGKWVLVYNGFATGNYNASGCIYTAADGSFYTGGSRGMAHSTNGTDWEVLPNSPSIGGPNGGCSLVGDGTTLYASMGLIAYSPPSTDWFWTSSEVNPTTWAPMNNPSVITGGGHLRYDSDHHLLYSSNSTGGFYRVVVQ